MEFSVAILAGGLATRLRPITETIPKSMVEVAGRPFIEHQLHLLRENQLTDIVLCVGHLGEKIEQHLGDGKKFGVTLSYSFDGPALLGTGGALRQALPLLKPDFFVLYGDSFLPINYQAVGKAYQEAKLPALMTVYLNSGKWDTSNVWFEQGEIKSYDKTARLPQMRHIDYGLSVMNRSVIEPLPTDRPTDLAPLLTTLVQKKQLVGYEVERRFYEIGSPAGLAELNQLLS